MASPPAAAGAPVPRKIVKMPNVVRIKGNDKGDHADHAINNITFCFKKLLNNVNNKKKTIDEIKVDLCELVKEQVSPEDIVFVVKVETENMGEDDAEEIYYGGQKKFGRCGDIDVPHRRASDDEVLDCLKSIRNKCNVTTNNNSGDALSSQGDTVDVDDVDALLQACLLTDGEWYDVPDLFPRISKRNVEEWGRLQDQIESLPDLEQCGKLYMASGILSVGKDTLRSFQQDFTNKYSANSSVAEAKEYWARCWAQKKTFYTSKEGWPWVLDDIRKTLVVLLKRICDLTFSEDERKLIDKVRVEKGNPEELKNNQKCFRAINEIVALCLCMDRANCLYHMINDATNDCGFVWYSIDYQREMEEAEKQLENKRFMNWRYTWLYKNEVLKAEVMDLIEDWMTKAEPPRLESVQTHQVAIAPQAQVGQKRPRVSDASI